MEDTMMSVVGILVAAIIMFVVPLILIADRTDDIAHLTIQTATSDFVDNVIKSGKITNDDYSDFRSRISASGNRYDVDMELKILDPNTVKKYILDSNSAVTQQNTYYSLFSSQIEEKLSKVYNTEADNSGEIILKEGDVISVTVKNNSLTISQSLKNVYYKLKGENLHIIAATASGTIAINGAT